MSHAPATAEGSALLHLAIAAVGVWRIDGMGPPRLDRAELTRRLAHADLDLAALEELADHFEAGCLDGAAGKPLSEEEDAPWR